MAAGRTCCNLKVWQGTSQFVCTSCEDENQKFSSLYLNTNCIILNLTL